jgi:hypothetical protein
MAVVKNNYIPKGKLAFAKAKQTLIYNETRKGHEKEKIILPLFNHDGEVSEEQALQFLHDKPKDWYYWRIMISPDPGKNEDLQKDLDMRGLAKKAIQSIETYLNMEGQINFVGALHTDRAHRHVHAIIYLPRVTREQFEALSYMPRHAATKEALSQRQSLDLHQELRQSQHKFKERSIVPLSPFYTRTQGKTDLLAQPCPNGTMHDVVRLKNGKYYCKTDRRILEREEELSL